MRSKTTIEKMKSRIGQANIDACLNVDDFWRGFEYALMWVLGKIDLEDEVSDYESETEAWREGYKRDPATGEYVSIVELYPESFNTFGEEEFETYIGEDWRERLEARGYDWRAHLEKTEECSLP